MQVAFCDLLSAVVLAHIARSSRRQYRTCVTVYWFCRLIFSTAKPHPQKPADFVDHLTSTLLYQLYKTVFKWTLATKQPWSDTKLTHMHAH